MFLSRIQYLMNYESLLGYYNVDWFVNEIIKLEKNGFLF